MPLQLIKVQVRQYALIAIMLVISWFLSAHFTSAVRDIFASTDETQTLFVLFALVIVFSLGFIVYELAKPTVLPSFVLAILFGIVTRNIFSTLIASPVSLTTLITIGAVLILFGGGLDIPFVKFRALLGPILALAIPGTIINAILLSIGLNALSPLAGTPLLLGPVILLGAALASTDPAAIIPSFESLHFQKSRVKHIAISESAINDVVGAVLVTIFLSLILSGVEPVSVLDAYSQLLSVHYLYLILQVVTIGCIGGLLGYGVLRFWSLWKQKIQTEDGTDAALFLAVPFFAFTLAEILGGSGYLAAFLSSLMFNVQSHCKHVEHYFNHTVEGFMKPMIFILLGAMVSPSQLFSVATVGITAGLVFMFVLRPLTVVLCLTPFHFFGQKLTIKEMCFLSFVRETGVIPAALLITIQLTGIPGTDVIVPIGLWVILLTLLIEPPLTPIVAKKLAIASDKSSLPQRKHIGPVAILCSRGYSFPERMNTVVEWAQQHGVDNIALLHCPEDKYTDEFVADVRKRASDLFRTINKKLTQDGKKSMNFEFLCGPGLLQDNINTLLEDGDVSIIFVGAKMLDYRLEDVKNLAVPFFFMP